jgi:hypothetical protein
MSAVAERTDAPAAVAGFEAGAVLLVTIDVRYADDAVAFATDSAAEARARLLVVDVIPAMRVPAPGNVRMFGSPGVLIEQQEIAAAARARGITAQTAVLSHPRPLRAVRGVLEEHAIGILVFGPDRGRYGRRRHRRHVALLRREAPCLVWPLD